jgi:phage gpG-like protein
MTTRRSAVKVDADRMSVVVDNLEDAQPLLRGIGSYLVSQTVRGFAQQGRNGRNEWLPRSVPNRFGAISDLNKGPRIKSRRFEGRPALRDTGKLAQSITYVVTGHAVFVGSNLSYAKTQQEGGPISATLTGRGQENLRKWLGSSDAAQHEDSVPALAKLLADPTLNSKAMARRFVVITDKDRKAILDRVSNWTRGSS